MMLQRKFVKETKRMTPLEAYKLLESYLAADNKNLSERQQAIVNKQLQEVRELIRNEKYIKGAWI